MSDKKPMILVFAGPNGSGKSTITQYFETVGMYTNADDIVAATGMRNQDAAAFVDRKRKEDISIFPNDLWTKQKIMSLIGE